MSYITAFVRFSESDPLYPVNCWRSDVVEGDAVVVRLNSRRGQLRRAVIEYLAFLNWKCANEIVCHADEADFTPDGIFLLATAKQHVGINRPIDVWNDLKRLGWRIHQTRSKTYKFACSSRNKSKFCCLFFRKNGVDIQVLGLEDAFGQDGAPVGFASTSGEVYRADCRQTETNFYEHLCRYAKAFSNDDDYRMVAFPSRSYRRIPWTPGELDRDTNWRDAFDGLPGPVYLHDGQYL